MSLFEMVERPLSMKVGMSMLGRDGTTMKIALTRHLESLTPWEFARQATLTGARRICFPNSVSESAPAKILGAQDAVVLCMICDSSKSM